MFSSQKRALSQQAERYLASLKKGAPSPAAPSITSPPPKDGTKERTRSSLSTMPSLGGEVLSSTDTDEDDVFDNIHSNLGERLVFELPSPLPTGKSTKESPERLPSIVRQPSRPGSLRRLSQSIGESLVAQKRSNQVRRLVSQETLVEEEEDDGGGKETKDGMAKVPSAGSSARSFGFGDEEEEIEEDIVEEYKAPVPAVKPPAVTAPPPLRDTKKVREKNGKHRRKPSTPPSSSSSSTTSASSSSRSSTSSTSSSTTSSTSASSTLKSSSSSKSSSTRASSRKSEAEKYSEGGFESGTSTRRDKVVRPRAQSAGPSSRRRAPAVEMATQTTPRFESSFHSEDRSRSIARVVEMEGRIERSEDIVQWMERRLAVGEVEDALREQLAGLRRIVDMEERALEEWRGALGQWREERRRRPRSTAGTMRRLFALYVEQG